MDLSLDLERLGERVTHGSGITLDHEIEIAGRGGRAPHRIPEGPADHPRRIALEPLKHHDHGIRGERVPDPRINGVKDSYDPLSEKLPANAPIDPALVAALARWEHLTVPQLEEEFRLNEDRFRVWVQDPANEGRPFQEFPEYIDRLAIDTLIERRTWAE